MTNAKRYDITKKFRQLCSDFDNQNVALNALISAYEVQQAKVILTERQTDVSDYDTHLSILKNWISSDRKSRHLQRKISVLKKRFLLKTVRKNPTKQK